MPGSRFRGVLALSCAGVFALSGVTLVNPASAAPTAAAAAPELPDINDFHTDARYRKYYDQQLTWAPCDVGQGGHLCATAIAPKNWFDPSKGDISLALSRPLDAEGKPLTGERLLLTNPGGPGGPDRGFGKMIAQLFHLNGTHTVVDVDPRGVGASTPLDCAGHPVDVSGGDHDSRHTTRQEAADAQRGVEAWLNECRAKNPDVLPYLNSDQTARDLNLVRAVMGFASTDFYGVSYGTWLGSYYAKAFPRTTDRVVLDSNMDWMYPMERALRWNTTSYQENYDRVGLPWLARHNQQYGLGGTAAEVNATVERIRQAAGEGKLGGLYPDAVDLLSLLAARDSGLPWAGMMFHLLNRALLGDADGVAALPEVVPQLNGLTSGILPAFFPAVICNDSPAARNQNAWFDEVSARLEVTPTASVMGYAAEFCAHWPTPPALDFDVIHRPLDAVAVQNEMDPNTPYAGFLETLWLAHGTITPVFVDNQVGHGALFNPAAAAVMSGWLGQGRRPAHALALPGEGLPDEEGRYEYKSAATKVKPLPFAEEYRERELVDPPLLTDPPPPTPQSVPDPDLLARIQRYIDPLPAQHR